MMEDYKEVIVKLSMQVFQLETLKFALEKGLESQIFDEKGKYISENAIKQINKVIEEAKNE